MDELIDQFTKETGIKVEQQRITVAGPLREAPGVGAGRRGAGPLPDPPGRDPALRERRDPRSRWTTGTLGGKGFRGEDYIPSTWQGGIFQGKRYSIPLDVPQHILYFNVKIMKDAGLVGADGQPKVPVERGRARGDGQADHQGRHVRIRDRQRTQHRPVHLWLPSHALAERREHLRRRPQARRGGRAGGRRGRRVLGLVPRPAQGGAAGEREPPRRLHRGQARHVAGRLLELHRPPGRQGRLHGGAGAPPLEAARRLDDPAPVRVPEAQGRWTRPSETPPDPRALDVAITSRSGRSRPARSRRSGRPTRTRGSRPIRSSARCSPRRRTGSSARPRRSGSRPRT